MTDEPLFDLIGGRAIADFVLGKDAPVRQLYRLIKSARMPIINDGGRLRANSKTLVLWKRDREREALLGLDKSRAIKKLKEEQSLVEAQQQAELEKRKRAEAPVESDA